VVNEPLQIDARTITETIDLPGTTITIGTVSEDRRVMNVSVTVLEDLMDAPDFTVDIGEETLWQFSQHGAPFAGVYSVESDLMTLNREDIVINIPSNTASGSVKVEVTYI
jgi:hypothetical protein